MSEPTSPATGQSQRTPPLIQRFFTAGGSCWGARLSCLSPPVSVFTVTRVILDPLRERYGWSKGVISSAVTLYFFTSGVMGMLMGRFIDRYGPNPY